MAKKCTKNGIAKFLIVLIEIVFLVTLFATFWSWINDNGTIILIISGGLLVLYSFIFPIFSWKKFFRGLKKKF